MVPFKLRTSLAVVGFATAFTLWSAAARAQSIVVNEANIARLKTLRTDTTTNYISLADCKIGDQFKFPISMTGYSGYDGEVWATMGAACTESDQRQTDGDCWKVEVFEPTQANMTLPITVHDILAGIEGTGPVKDCVPPEDMSSNARDLTLYFMLFSGAELLNPNDKPWTTKLDLVGPEPPSEVKAGIGDSILVMEWTQNNDSDLTGYQFFCDPMPGKEPGTDAGTQDAALSTRAGDAAVFDGSLSDSGAGDDAETDAETDAQDDAAAEGGATDAATETGGSTASICPSTIIKTGGLPPSDNLCGSAGKGGSGTIKGLQNGVSYTVAVAGVDAVGNVGQLSNVACETPQPVDDFFKVYRDAGGQAGGGFCTTSGAIGHGAGFAGLGLLIAAAIGGMVRRRNRR